jgi:hypothetical protein
MHAYMLACGLLCGNVECDNWIWRSDRHKVGLVDVYRGKQDGVANGSKSREDE